MPQWYLLYLGCSQLKSWDKISITNNIYKPLGTCDGSFAIALNSMIFYELLISIEHSLQPFDTGPLRNLQNKYPDKCFCLYPNLIIADVRNSDIRSDSGITYMNKFSKKCKWNLSDYDFII